MRKILPTVHMLSKLGFLFSLTMVFPTLVSYIYGDEAFFSFAGTALVAIVLSVSAWIATRAYQRELRPRDGFALVTALWIGFALVAAFPMYLYLPEMSFADAFFEAMSGLTTTGATVIDGLDTLAPSINFWRHLLNWLGGMGIIVLAVAVLPMLGVGGTQLFKAEITGIEKDNKNAPRISQTAKRLWMLYLAYTLWTLLALHWAGMTWFDALCHAMASLALGGFSTHDNSIAYFDSPLIEWIIIVATIIGGINFANHFTAFKEKTVRHYWHDEEVRTTLLLLGGSIVVASLYLWYKDFYGLADAFRYVSFNFVSIGMANGFTNADFGTWPLVVSLWMLFLSNVLANTGSTGGGIKMARMLTMAKFAFRESAILQHPNAVRTVKVNGRSLNERVAMSVVAFVFVYFMTVVVFSFLMMLSGLDLISGVTAVVACITNTGPGLGSVGPAHNYAALSDMQKWLLSAVMLLGRLEIFTVFILFTPQYWKK